MDARRAPRAVIDPKVRRVGFFAPPVMIPPPRHPSENLSLHARPAVTSPSVEESVTAESYSSSSDFFLAPMSPAPSSYSSRMVADNGDFFDDGKVASSFPQGGFDLTTTKASGVPASELTTDAVVNADSLAIHEREREDKGGGSAVEVKDQALNTKPKKEKTSKAERRALQEAQRAAKAVAKAEGNKASGTLASVNVKPAKAAKSPQKVDNASVAASEKKEGDRPQEKDRKKDVPQPRMQYDDKSRVEKAKRRAVVKQTEAKNRVELFRHLPQYEHGSQLPDLEAKFFHLDPVHPAVYKLFINKNLIAEICTFLKHTLKLIRSVMVEILHDDASRPLLGDLLYAWSHYKLNHEFIKKILWCCCRYGIGLQYLSGDITGGNARCIAMLQAFQEAIKDYRVPSEKTLVRDLTAKLSSYVSFLIECRPLSISMGNAIRFLKSRIAKLPLTLSESESKTSLQSDVERFINEKIILANKVIAKHAITKIRDGDVLLTYGSSSAVEMILLHAHELGKQFRVVVVDSRPRLRGKLLLRRLVEKGLSCTYTHINAVTYIMNEVTRVFLGASSVLSNGTVYSGVGTACVAMVAHAFRVPVLVCCEAYKFHERVQHDSICSNELGDPDIISRVQSREDVNHLEAWANTENLQLLNLIYDATPSDYVSMIITDYGMVPPTSVPVIVREYSREQVWI